MTASPQADPTIQPLTRFSLPRELAAGQPPEARGLARDAVRLLIATAAKIEHTRFAELGRYLRPGDLLVVNTSATRAAAVNGVHPELGPVVVHFSTALDDDSWVVELRTAPLAAKPVRNATAGTRIQLPDGVTLTLLEPSRGNSKDAAAPLAASKDIALPRLWRTKPLKPSVIDRLLAQHGRPISYGYLSTSWPLGAYQTIFATQSDDQASAEMPSAGRPFSPELVTRLVSQGIQFAPIALHAGVSSLEPGEPPPAERYRVSAHTALLANWTRGAGGRVIAVGTTATRALESAVQPDGTITAADGWTELTLGPDHPARIVDGLITGLHDPDASHLLLLEAVAGPALVQRTYDAALNHHYLWHEFGDTTLLLPT
jgi:S-adenosylmethionine:tRNA ribosyltransferase-isomerase